ncbi:MAG: ATP-binding protein [Alistipes putredinis]|nr:MAG: ATP-binding protein [Alistipes putredinis]
MDDGGQMIEKEPLNLVDVISEVIGDTAVAASERGFRVTTSLPDKIMMQGSHSMLLSVFRNLMDNALAYSGGENIEISLVRRDENFVTMSLCRRRGGVALEHRPRIIERFYRVDKGRSRKLGGTGLGLAIVKNAVLLHGGTISAYLRDMGD